MIEVIIDGVRFVPEREPKHIKATIGFLARSARKRKRESLAAASENMCMSKSYLWMIEKGTAPDPGLSIVLSLIHYYGLDFNQISFPTNYGGFLP